VLTLADRGVRRTRVTPARKREQVGKEESKEESEEESKEESKEGCEEYLTVTA
jgi:hypothetical protein